MLLLVPLLYFLPALAATSPAPAVTITKPPKGTCTIGAVAVEAPDISTDGGGCRAGTVGVAVSDDNSLLTFIFDDFEAAIGPNAGNAKRRALCRVNVTMSSPGWAFDVNTVDFRGFVSLASGVGLSIVSRWKWVDRKGVDLPGQGNMQKKLQGPFDTDILLHSDGETTDEEQSSCSKANAVFQLTLSATLSASDTTLSGVVQRTSANDGFSEILNLAWKKC